MATTRTFSISGNNESLNQRRESITAQDVGALARVDTVVAADAAKATQTEVNMTLSQGLKIYPKAIGWSVLLSTCIVMEGFDLVLINSLVALPAFQMRFGDPVGDGTYQISAAWQSGLANGALVGEMLGLMLIGLIVERLGYKKTLIGALTMITGLIFIVFFAQSLPMLLVGEILMGIPWGAFQTLTTTYAAEVCPVQLRAYLTTYVNLCWVLGQFLSSGVLKGVSGETGPIGYKLPYALQWIWPIPLIIGIALAPESPWWLVRHQRFDEAKHSLQRLTSKGQGTVDHNEIIAMMLYTDELEKASTAGVKYIDCFKGTNLRRTEIVCMVWAIQTLCGSAFIGYSTYFFEQAGLDVSSAFSMTLGVYGLGAVGTISSWFLMMKVGRRNIYLYGQVCMVCILLIIGFLGIIPRSATGAQWAIGALLIIYTFVYDFTVGPVCYSLVAEISSTRLRNKSVILARNFYNITGIIANILTPRMLSPTAWAWGAKAGFFWAGVGALCTVYTFFRIPEPKDRTYAEMDMLFEAKVSARKFKHTSVENFASAGSDGHMGSVEKQNVAMNEKS
ncbi:hypothetical protein LTR95_005146 [Oleoguttula sp. CCFEE 5521]